MIRSTKTTIYFSNKNKINSVHQLINEYKSLVIQFVDILWKLDKIPKLLTKDITNQITTTNLSQRLIQCAGKQASGIVRGTRTKQKKRLYKIQEFNEKGYFKKARKLQQIYDKVKVSKPNIENVQLELDSRFVEINIDNATSFDGWITINSIKPFPKLIIPFKRTKHFNKLYKKGKLKSGIRLSTNYITFMFDIQTPEIKKKGKILGIDIGKKNTISCSNNHFSLPNNHKHDLNTILEILSRKKKGSKGFQRTQEHRKNYINWTINQLNLKNIKQINIEKIRNIRLGKRINRKLSHWTYTDIFDKLAMKCEELGVQVQHISPTYTSQRCSACGWTRKSNRKGKIFKCEKCNFTLDSDLNASRNIALPLFAISKQQRLKQANRKGFYWFVEGQEPIVPAVLKTLKKV